MHPDNATKTSATVRRRLRSDLPVLWRRLLEQQPGSRYPFRDPVPVPPEQFLHAEDAVGAWTAVLEGEPSGHVCRVGPASGFPDADDLNAVCASAHGCQVEDLSWIGALFTASHARGLGLGERLLHTAVSDARAAGARPCLEVLTVHPAALSLYRKTGWRVVTRIRPEWLSSVTGDAGPDVLVMVMAD